MKIAIIKAPSILGLRPTGVEFLPDALEKAGLFETLSVVNTTLVSPPPYSTKRESNSHILNEQSLADYSKELADAVGYSIQKEQFPLVLGGDCSIILGAMLALKRLGRYGLFFMDGHADFYQPEASPTGEAADMDLALLTGRGPEIVTNIEQRKPYARDEDVVQFGQRDREETIQEGSQQIADTHITVIDLESIQKLGIEEATRRGVDVVTRNDLQGLWIHLDVDVINDEEMPAVDYRLPDGLRFEDISKVLSSLIATDKVVGMSLAIFNPKLDPENIIAKKLVHCLKSGLRS